MSVSAAGRVKLLFGGKSTMIGWTWIALFSWFMVLWATYEWEASRYARRVPGHINAVTEATYYGSKYYVADFYYKDLSGTQLTDRSMSKRRPELGDHEVALDGGTPILVDMMRVPEPLPTGLLLFTLLGFVLMAFEVVAAVRTLRAGHEVPAANWSAYLLLILPAIALIGLASALYYFFAFR